MPVVSIGWSACNAVMEFAQTMKAPEVALKDRRPAPGEEMFYDDWLWVKPIPLKAGEVCEQHVHLHDHASLVATGTVRLWVDGQDRGEVSAPKIVKINALAQHKFLAVTDAVIVCIHNLRGEGYPAIMEDV